VPANTPLAFAGSTRRSSIIIGEEDRGLRPQPHIIPGEKATPAMVYELFRYYFRRLARVLINFQMFN